MRGLDLIVSYAEHLHPKRKKVGKDESKANSACVQFLKEDTRVQAYLGDTAGLVPDYCNKASISTKQVTQIF